MSSSGTCTVQYSTVQYSTVQYSTVQQERYQHHHHEVGRQHVVAGVVVAAPHLSRAELDTSFMILIVKIILLLHF